MAKKDEFLKAKALGEAALAAMVRHNVPPTPRNFTLWFAHVSGAAPELSRTLDTLTSNRQPLTPEVVSELRDRFLGADAALAAEQQTAVVQQTNDQLQQTVSRALSHVQVASGTARAYGRTLDDYSARLLESKDSGNLNGIVAELMAETKRIAERNEILESKLTETSGEIQELRQNLAAAQLEVMTDALTGVANRKSFERRAREAAANAIESGDPLSLLFIDIDYFKRFNDTYGHQIGDQVLRLVGRTLTENVKGRDTVARYGGEEFVILLPQTRREDAVRVAEQIRGIMMRRKITGKTSGDDYGNITVSIGVGGYIPGEPFAELIRRADAALYCAKGRGRNRVICEDDPALNLAASA